MEEKLELNGYQNANTSYKIFKRIIDVVGSLVAILLFLPVVFMLSIFYLFGDNKGPIFFKQRRIGINGEIFYIYKFRSMVVDAENKLKSNPQLYAKYIQNNYKLEQDEDPRITKFGRFLRVTSLDEIPQFFNVLKGNMSLVGPRPVIEEELKEYGNSANKFLSVKPGITGYWQAIGRSSIGYPERVDIELYYIDNKSILLDVKILFNTVVTVLLRKGAY